MEAEGRIVELNSENLQSFRDFCRRNRSKVDDSYLYEDDLSSFEPNPENPTFLYLEGGKVVAAASLIIDEYNRKGNRARFRILYSEKDSKGIYDGIFHRILIHALDLDNVYIFVPTYNDKLMARMEKLGFCRERYTYLMVREDDPVKKEELPEGFALKAFDPERDIDEWCSVRNICFATVKGNETPINPEMVRSFAARNDYLESGMIILTHNGKAVGIVRGTRDEYEGKPIMNIGSVAVLPEYQGRGLGRVLLREAIRFAKRSGFSRTVLSVNADNEGARKIYDREGFKEVEGVVCYVYPVH